MTVSSLPSWLHHVTCLLFFGVRKNWFSVHVGNVLLKKYQTLALWIFLTYMKPKSKAMDELIPSSNAWINIHMDKHTLTGVLTVGHEHRDPATFGSHSSLHNMPNKIEFKMYIGATCSSLQDIFTSITTHRVTVFLILVLIRWGQTFQLVSCAGSPVQRQLPDAISCSKQGHDGVSLMHWTPTQPLLHKYHRVISIFPFANVLSASICFGTSCL